MKEPEKPGDTAQAAWTVLSPSGRVLGTVHVPRGLNVRQIGGDWLLGVAVDSDEVEHVRLYRLKRG